MLEKEVHCPQCAAQVPAGATRCERCGAAVPAGIENWFNGPEPPPFIATRTVETPPPLPLEALQPPPLPPPPPPPGEVLILDEPIEPPVARLREPEPPEVPVVRPTARRAQRLDELPEAQPLPPYRRTLLEARPTSPQDRPGELPRSSLPPVRDQDHHHPPKPRILLAMMVLLAMAIAFACGLSVIIYALYAGLKASQPGRTEAPPALLPRDAIRPVDF